MTMEKEKTKFVFKDVIHCRKCGKIVRKVGYIDAKGYQCSECAWE